MPLPIVPEVPLPIVPEVPLPVVPLPIVPLPDVPVLPEPLLPLVLLPMLPVPLVPDEPVLEPVPEVLPDDEVPPPEGADGSVLLPPLPVVDPGPGDDDVPALPAPPVPLAPVLPPVPVPCATAQPPATVMQAAATIAKCLSFLLIQCSYVVEKVRSPGSSALVATASAVY